MIILVILPPPPNPVLHQIVQYGLQPIRKYGFTATRAETGDENGWKTINQHSIITFSKIVTNIGGAYDPSTSQFTCLIKGMYVIQVTVLSGNGHVTDYAALSVNGTLHLTAHARGSSGIWDQATQSVTMNVALGRKYMYRRGTPWKCLIMPTQTSTASQVG